MGKLPHRRMKQAEHDHTGCMWGLISMFDFRRGGYNRRLLPEKRFGNRVLFGAKTTMSSTESDYHLHHEDCDSTQPMLGAGKPSVKKLMEKDMVVDVEKGDSDFESQSHNKSSKPHQIKRTHFSLSSVSELEDFANDADINNAVQEIFSRIQQKHGCGAVHENDQIDAEFEKQLIEAAEVILHEKLLVGQDQKIDYSREFKDALETLISHKLLFFKLLENPDSELTRRINHILNSEQGKSFIQQEPEGSHNQKRWLFSRRRVRSQEAVTMTENEGAQTQSHGDVLNTELEALRTAVEVNNPTPSLKIKSIFSFTEIKRRLKHAMGKDRDGVSTKNEIVKKVSRGSQVLRPSGETALGRMSPSRNPHLEAEVHPKRLSSPRKSEVESPSHQKMSNSYVDSASKQSSPMQINDDDNQKFSNRQEQDMELARTSSSASEKASLPIFTHAKESSCTSPTADKRMSSPRKPPNANEDSEGVKQYKHVNAAEEPSTQSLMVESSESDDTFSAKLESWDPSPIISEYKAFDEEDESHYSVEMCPEEVSPEKFNTDDSTEYPTSCDTVNSEDTSEVIDSLTITDSEEQDKDEENCTAASQLMLAPICLGGDDETEIVDNFMCKIEKPSPISVLETMFLDDEISPPSSKILQRGPPVAPLQIRFDEDDVSESDRSTFDNDDNESKRKYIQKILTSSGFSWDMVYLKSLSSEQLLDASLYDADVDILSDQSSNDYKLLFDCLNEVLMDTCARYFGGCPLASFLKHNIRQFPDNENAFREIWQGVEWHLRPLSHPRSLEQMVEKDLAKDGKWMDLQFDAEIISREIEDAIFEELLEDTTLSCMPASVKTQKYRLQM